MKRAIVFNVIVLVSLLLAACGGGGAGGGAAGSGGGYNTDFPLPAAVSNFTESGGAVNFQAKLTIEESIQFYRDAMTEAGLSERTINTAITESTFSLVFDGDPSGKAIVVQGVDLGGGSTNINIRLEDV